MTTKPNPINGAIKRGQILIVEAFPKPSIKTINEKFTELTGLNPSEGTIGELGTPLATKTYAWKVSQLDVFYEALLSSQSVARMNEGIDRPEKRDEIKKALLNLITRVDLLTTDADGIPFYIAVIRVTLNASGLPSSQEATKSIERIRFLFRLFMGDLGGNSGKSAITLPACPAIVFLGVVVSQEEISSLQHDASRLQVPGIPFSESQRISEDIRGRLPVKLASIDGADHISHFSIAPNISLLVGHIDQLGLVGIRTPYMLLLVAEEGQLGFLLPEMPLFPYVSSRAFDGLLRGPEMFVIPLACHASINDFWLRIKELENELGLSSNSLAKGSQTLETPDVVDALSRTGVNLAALDVNVGMIERRVIDVLKNWSRSTTSEWREMPIPPVGISGRTMIARGSKSGYTSNLADEVTQNFMNMKSTLEGLERQTELLFRQVHDDAMRSATQQMKKSTTAVEEATTAMARSQNQVELLTYVLVTLTMSLVGLGMWANGWKWQSLIVEAGAFVMAGLILLGSRLNSRKQRK